MHPKELETLDAVIADLQRLNPEHPQHPVALAFGLQSVVDSAIDRLQIIVAQHRLLPDTRPDEVVLTDDQKAAWAKLTVWAYNDEPYFVLRGYPGTGKTFLMQMLKTLDVSIFFSAPTNKATKVLSKAVKAKAKTTFSLLGLRMTQQEGELVMEYGKVKPYFPPGSIMVVDEASMPNSELVDFIDQVRREFQIKVLYVGDPAQLNPVGERTSRSWTMATKPECRAVLRQVVRFDDQFLRLSMRIRDHLKRKLWISPLIDDHDPVSGKGVHIMESQKLFYREILKNKQPSDFAERKVIAWRNKTVDRYNAMIRENFGFSEPYCVGDLIMLAEPILEDDVVIAHTDDDFTITEVTHGSVTVDDVCIETHQLTVTNDEQTLLLQIPIKMAKLDAVLAERARLANNKKKGRERAERWKAFWDIKKKFHSVRYGYAITSHRVQGSTIHTAYVDQVDILANRTKREAFRSLMVACTRQTDQLYSF